MSSKKLAELAAKVFRATTAHQGRLPGGTGSSVPGAPSGGIPSLLSQPERSGAKILAGKMAGPKVLSWYPPELDIVSSEDPAYTFIDLDRIHQEAKLARLKRRGKGPPKKGAGKRAKRKK